MPYIFNNIHKCTNGGYIMRSMQYKEAKTEIDYYVAINKMQHYLNNNGFRYKKLYNISVKNREKYYRKKVMYLLNKINNKNFIKTLKDNRSALDKVLDNKCFTLSYLFVPLIISMSLMFI